MLADPILSIRINAGLAIAFALLVSTYNPSTTITYALEEPVRVHLAVLDFGGREVTTLVNARQPKGRYSVKWHALHEGSSNLASGTYFARLEVDGQLAIKKMMFTK